MSLSSAENEYHKRHACCSFLSIVNFCSALALVSLSPYNQLPEYPLCLYPERIGNSPCRLEASWLKECAKFFHPRDPGLSLVDEYMECGSFLPDGLDCPGLPIKQRNRQHHKRRYGGAFVPVWR